MATSMAPPPGMAQGQDAPTPPQGGPSPTPPQPGGVETNVVVNVHQVVAGLRSIAKAVPGAMPVVEQMLAFLPDLQKSIMKTGPTPEPMAPPS